MILLSNALNKQVNAIRRYPLVFIAIVITSLLIILLGIKHSKIIQSIVYLFTVWLCMYCVDVFTERKNNSNEEFPVRQAGKETFYVIVCFLLGFLFLFVRFVIPEYWEASQGIVRMGLASLIIFVFPIALAIIMLLLKYKLKDLGIRRSGILVTLPIILILALSTFLIAPENIAWIDMYKSEGLFGLLMTGLIASGLSEEFWRFIAQTRFAAFLNNKAWGWFLATFIWAMMHAPKWYSEDHDLIEALLGAIRIIPIGLMWGYLTARTKSILPATLVHGTNLWGLQNF